ncbi:MAG: hypothetical protein P8K64_04185, partial [Acidimicrobiales bacterium]|nr:hypothetical protein [Acidimicrobiales bacterium]
EEKEEDEEEEDEEEESGPRPSRHSGDEGEDDEPDPDDVEADLEEILRDRIAADADEGGDGEEEEDPGQVEVVAKSPEEAQARQKTEMSCPHCFLLVDETVVSETGECSQCGAPI